MKNNRGREKGFITKILHQRFSKEDVHGALHMPVYDNVAFEFKSAEEIELAFQGKSPAHMYSRITNPTVEFFEQQIQAITGARAVVALSSGMAAIVNTILLLCQAGDSIVTSKHLFGNTYSLFEYTLKSWGLVPRYVDLTDTCSVEKAIDNTTRMIFFETITNPQLEVADAAALADIARQNKLVLIADTTLTPPYIFDSKKFGVDIEVLSSTKYISGGATTVGGVIIDNGTYAWENIHKLKKEVKKFGPYAFINKLRREVFRNMGACLSPHNAFLQSMGLETLPLRIDVSCANSLALAKALEANPAVDTVNYPGLESSPFYEVASRQFHGVSGGLITFDLETKEQCFQFMNALRLIRRATNLNDNRTLVLHPASTIFAEYSVREKEEMNVRETMIRMAVGIEDKEDLLEDIEQALEVV